MNTRARARRQLMTSFLFLAFAASVSVAAQPDAPGSTWPSFRGSAASGVADGQGLPDRWNAEEMTNILWKIPIPGLAHSSPIVWGDRVFVTTAVNRENNAEFKPGLYGDGTTAADRTVAHQFKVLALEASSGKVVWEKVAYSGAPRAGRHIKSTYANPTPATNGEVLVAFFCSEGLFAYDLEGTLLWKKDLGVIKTSAYDVPDYEWGCASSPILWQDLVIVQADTTDTDFLAAFEAKTGKEVWRVERQGPPSWATPNVYEGPKGAELVTNAPGGIRGYDPRTGTELWHILGSSNITAPTPVFTPDLLVVTSGRRPEKPLYVVRAGSRGDLSLGPDQTSNASIVWSKTGRGPYMPTPLIYRGFLYTLNNDGVFDRYDLNTGAELYRERVPHRGGGFSASPVAADGKIYLASEDGDVFVLGSGAAFELVATNPMGETLMATPALAGGRLFVRGRNHLFAVGLVQKPQVSGSIPP